MHPQRKLQPFNNSDPGQFKHCQSNQILNSRADQLMAENTIVKEVLQNKLSECVLETECGNCGNGTATAYCNDCKEFICNECRAIHNKVKLLKTHCITNSNCPIHPKNAITLFCETCNELICTECAADHPNHIIICHNTRGLF